MRRIDNTLGSESYRDGIVWLYPLSRKGEPDTERGIRLSYGERNLTYKRILEARQVQSEYSRVIGVPLIMPGGYGKMRCAAIGGIMYRIETVQEIHTAIPPTAVLGLSDWDISTNY